MSNHKDKLNDVVANMQWDVQPSRDLWPEIKNTIEGDRPNIVNVAENTRRNNLQVIPYAVAACFVLAISSIIFNILAFQKLTELSELQVAQLERYELNNIASVKFTHHPSLVRTQITKLIKDEKHRLDPNILIEIEQALATIDNVYVELSASIHAQPHSEELTELLLETYTQEAQILETLRSSRGISL